MQRKVVTVLFTIIIVIVIDQVTKFLAVAYLKSAAPITYLGDLFRLQYAENHGAFLSLGAILPEQARFWIFTIVAAGVLLGIFLYAIFGSDDRRSHTVIYGFIVAGGIGNLIDRVSNDGAVIDFLNVGLGGLRTGIFNVADMAITGGVIALVVLSFFEYPREADRPAEVYAAQNQPNSDLPS